MNMNEAAHGTQEERLVRAVNEAVETVKGAEREVVVDLSSATRIDASALQALHRLADSAATTGTKVVLRGVNIEVYRVLKLVNLTTSFSFA